MITFQIINSKISFKMYFILNEKYEKQILLTLLFLFGTLYLYIFQIFKWFY